MKKNYRKTYAWMTWIGYLFVILGKGGGERGTAAQSILYLIGVVILPWGSIGYARSKGYEWACGLFGPLAVLVISFLKDKKKLEVPSAVNSSAVE